MRALLIADDCPSVLQTLDYVFGLHGYRVLPAGSGRVALEIAHRERFDAALIDLHMPGMDGVQTCRELLALARETGQMCPVWLMTAAVLASARQRALEAGAVGLLAKPFDCAAFLMDLEHLRSKSVEPAESE